MSENMNENNSDLTPEELQDAGSIEANTWTITPPGGQAMSLDEHEEKHQKRVKEAAAIELPAISEKLEDIPGTSQWHAKIDAGRGFE